MTIYILGIRYIKVEALVFQMRCRRCGFPTKEGSKELMAKLMAGEVLSNDEITILQFSDDPSFCDCVIYPMAINWEDPPKWWKGI